MGSSLTSENTEVFIFRNGGKLVIVLWWSYLNVSTYYTLWRLLFSNRLSWSKSAQNVVNKAINALSSVQVFGRRYISPTILFKIFDVQIMIIIINVNL